MVVLPTKKGIHIKTQGQGKEAGNERIRACTGER